MIDCISDSDSSLSQVFPTVVVVDGLLSLPRPRPRLIDGVGKFSSTIDVESEGKIIIFTKYW